MTRLLLAFVLLSGCASKPPEVVYKTTEVQVPVSAPCPVDVPPPMNYESGVLSISSSDFQKIKFLLIERHQRIDTEAMLRALLRVCTEGLNTPDE